MPEPEPVQPDASARAGWSAEGAQLKELINEKIAGVQRAVDVAREGVPPHVTIQDYFERLDALRDRYEDKLAVEREKGIQLALASADKLEQERIARATDQTECERRIGDLRAEMQKMAIDKAETSQTKQFDEFSRTVEEQIGTLRTALQDLTRRFDKLA
jgi:hypothetical protein